MLVVHIKVGRPIPVSLCGNSGPGVTVEEWKAASLADPPEMCVTCVHRAAEIEGE